MSSPSLRVGGAIPEGIGLCHRHHQIGEVAARRAERVLQRWSASTRPAPLRCARPRTGTTASPRSPAPDRWPASLVASSRTPVNLPLSAGSAAAGDRSRTGRWSPRFQSSGTGRRRRSSRTRTRSGSISWWQLVAAAAGRLVGGETLARRRRRRHRGRRDVDVHRGRRHRLAHQLGAHEFPAQHRRRLIGVGLHGQEAGLRQDAGPALRRGQRHHLRRRRGRHRDAVDRRQRAGDERGRRRQQRARACGRPSTARTARTRASPPSSRRARRPSTPGIARRPWS